MLLSELIANPHPPNLISSPEAWLFGAKMFLASYFGFLTVLLPQTQIFSIEGKLMCGLHCAGFKLPKRWFVACCHTIVSLDCSEIVHILIDLQVLHVSRVS